MRILPLYFGDDPFQGQGLVAIKFRREGKLEFMHTLNGTGATARALLSIMENFQDEGGKIAVPEVLRPFGAPPAIGNL